jgi:hypothetical protein
MPAAFGGGKLQRAEVIVIERIGNSRIRRIRNCFELQAIDRSPATQTWAGTRDANSPIPSFDTGCGAIVHITLHPGWFTHRVGAFQLQSIQGADNDPHRAER